MALSYPRDMPDVGARSQSFEQQRVDYLSPETGGRLGAITAGWPLWAMSLTLNNMLFNDSDIWRAWVASQRGAQRLFNARDLDRPMPRAHANGRSFSKVAAGWSQAIDDDGTAIVTFTGLVPGMILSLGDYVDFTWSTWKRSLVRVVDGGSATAAGALTAAVEPPVPSLTPAGAVAGFYRPACLMRLVTASTQLGEQDLGYTVSGGKIVGVQDLIA